MASNNLDLSNKWDKIWIKSVFATHEMRTKRAHEKIKCLLAQGFDFKEGMKVLDTGCGDASTLILLEKKFKIKAYGLDISQQAIKRACFFCKQKNAPIKLVHSDIRSIPFPINYFDVILSWGVIEHLPDYGVAINELSRVLKPGGKLSLIQPNKLSFGPVQRKLLELYGKWEFGQQIEFSPRDLKNLLGRHFKNISCFARPPFKDLKSIYCVDAILNKFSEDWGHYLYVIAEKA